MRGLRKVSVMNRPHATTALASSALALILAAGPALADVTPAEVWQNLRSSYEQMGYQVDVGAEDASDQALSLTDVVLRSQADGQDTPDMAFTMPRIDLMPVGDGTVRSVIEGQMLVEMRNRDAEGGPAGFSLTMDAPGNETLSSGTPQDMRHDYVMPSMTLQGRALDDENEVPLNAILTNVTGSQSVTTGDDGASAQTYTGRADQLTMSIAAAGPSDVEGEDGEADGEAGGTDRFTAEFTIADLEIEGQGNSPAGQTDFNNRPSEALQAGFAAGGTVGMGATSGSFTATSRMADGEQQDSAGSFEAASGSLAIGIGAEGLSYEGGLTDIQTRITSSDMPFPIAYATRENRFLLSMPVLAGDEAQPFALRYVLDGLMLDDEVWAALDPETALPRDPASLTVDLSGEALVTRNFLDTEPEADADPQEAPPVPLLPRSLTINDLSLAALGASADLTGALTFGDDPSQPVGSLTGNFAGINGLLDRLVQMGVLPQDQLMGPRMMMAMFARPVDGDPDRLQTEIEFREGGSIFANGQQIQ